METPEFKTWAVVEVMGHVEYAGYVSQENIAGAPMLRIDVPESGSHPAFTKYIAPSALYGISPCSEETARLRSKSSHYQPFQSWDIVRLVEDNFEKSGRLLPKPKQDEDEQLPF